MDKIIGTLDLHSQTILLFIKDNLLILIIFYSVFLNSYMINRNVNRIKSNIIFSCIALVSVWQIYDFNPSVYIISNTVWFGAILTTFASGEKLIEKWKFFLYGSLVIIIPAVLFSVYFGILTKQELAMVNIAIFSSTILTCLCIPLATDNRYIKISTLILALIEISIHILPKMTGEIEPIWILSILNLVAYLIFMNSMHKFTDEIA